jgi:hypothetical protein
MEGYEILAAKEGGYCVRLAGNTGYRPILFAGRLDECLSFIRSKIDPDPLTPLQDMPA